MRQADVKARVMKPFRAGGPVEGMNRSRLLLLTTVGRRTGVQRTTPTGEDRAAAWADLIGAHPFFADHQVKAGREIRPVELV
jgi:hypothetical protein